MLFVKVFIRTFTMSKINGGYYIKARKIQGSEISHAPPHIREIWDWLLREANHSNTKYNGFNIKRGQLFRSYYDIRDGLHWMVGYRKMMYNENQTKKAMKYLREHLMITSSKELGGVLITILNYDYYQNPKNYERTNEVTDERTNEEPMKNHPIPDNNKNVKNVKKDNTPLPPWLDEKIWNEYRRHRKEIKSKLTPRAEVLAIGKLEKLKDAGNDPVEVINQSIMNGWKGLFELKGDNNDGNKRSDPRLTNEFIVGYESSKRDDERKGR